MLSRSLTAFSPVRTSIADILRDAESLKSGLILLKNACLIDGGLADSILLRNGRIVDDGTEAGSAGCVVL